MFTEFTRLPPLVGTSVVVLDGRCRCPADRMVAQPAAKGVKAGHRELEPLWGSSIQAALRILVRDAAGRLLGPIKSWGEPA